MKEALTTAVKQAGTERTDFTRLNRNITQLFGQISGSLFVPTLTQRQELEDLQKDFEKHNGALDTLLKTTVPGIEKQLRDAAIPRIVVR